MTYYKFYFFSILFLSLLIWNIIVYAIYYIDKRKSIKNKWRISEKALILIAFLFGSFGAISAMYLVRHKTKHVKFKVLIPLALVLNTTIICLVSYFVITK